jgi:hypothetical protein
VFANCYHFVRDFYKFFTSAWVGFIARCLGGLKQAVAAEIKGLDCPKMGTGRKTEAEQQRFPPRL